MTRRSVVVLDYGSGNVRSAVRALERAEAAVTLTADTDAAMSADGLLVPGVGAFGACMDGLRAVRGDRLIERRLAAGRPVLGICVGMQVLFERGVEHGTAVAGCGQWPGEVESIQAPIVPHMGWNTVECPDDSAMFSGLAGERFYFVHSYAVRRWGSTPTTPTAPTAPTPPAVTWASYGGDRFVAAVEDGLLWATQFHPEKSGAAGAQLLRNWLDTLRR